MDSKDEELLKVDPELEAIFKKHGIPKLPLPTRKTVPAFRKHYSAAIARYTNSPFAKSVLDAAPQWTEKDHQCPVGDGSSIPIRVYSPKDPPQSGCPLAVVFHGGGWFMGDLDTDDLASRVLCSKLGLVVVNVDYRLYPDVEFPVPVTDCYDVVKWISSNASTLNPCVNLSLGFLAYGTSGGGTYASICAHLARDDSLSPALTGLFISCPILSDETPDPADASKLVRLFPTRNRSQEQNCNAPLMTRAMQDSIGEFAAFDFTSPMLSPFHFKSHAGLPRTYTQVTGLDPWRDGGIIFHELLGDAGVQTRIDVYPGLPHVWWTTFPMLKATRRWMEDTLKGVEWLLEATRNDDVVKSGAKL